ncbi:sulfotransferase 1C4-like [Penaeus chinensis]|uniref:sulfotransferase 1C4-like n=1 Tax=Penaeus chinensis TaxID=139456 RepID=UPI001FB778B0|nr:sulfotransferase 1C4-like [Penaeus chinensis]
MALKLPVAVKDLPEEKVKQRTAQGMNPLQLLVYTEPGNVLVPEPYKRVAEKIYNFKFRTDDIVVTTFPKSGTLWTMELVWAMTNLDRINDTQKVNINDRVFMIDDDFLDLVNLEKAKLRFSEQCPDSELKEGVTRQLAEAATTPRIIWTHLPLSLLHPDLLKTCKVVYVARNPKDVCVSYYHFAKQLGERFFNGTFDNLLDAFMDNHLFYGGYWDHIRQARQQKDNPNFHMLFYEDLKTNILEELRKLSSFLGLEIDDDTLLKVSDYAKFDRMKVNPAMRTNLLNFEGNHCRKGQIGDWANIATPEMDAKIERWIQENSEGLDFTFRYK